MATLVESGYPRAKDSFHYAPYSLGSPEASTQALSDATLAWKKVQPLLSQTLLSEDEVKTIVDIEKNIYPPTQNHAQTIISSLILRGKEHPKYFSYALLALPLLEKHMSVAWERKIKTQEAASHT